MSGDDGRATDREPVDRESTGDDSTDRESTSGGSVDGGSAGGESSRVDGRTAGAEGDVSVESDAGIEEDAGAASGGWTPGFLVAARGHRYQPAVLLVAALVGLAVAWTHWLGLFVAGGLVGLVSRTLPRAVLAGLVVGVLVLLGHVLASPAMDPDEFLALTPPAYVTVAAALVAPTWGALVRGVA